MRPRFKLSSQLPAADVRELVKAAIKEDAAVGGWLRHHLAHVTIPEQHQHYWSPVLQATIDDNPDENCTFIRVLIGPRQSIWLVFTFLKGAIGVLGLFGGMYGFSQWQLGKPSYWLWAVPVALVLAGAVFGAAKLGQLKGRDQMEHLVRFLERSLKKAKVRRVEPED